MRGAAMDGTGNRGNTGPLFAALRCGARTRAGGACRSPAVAGRHRCRMHGGGGETGAPLENRNRLRHGLMTRDAKAFRRHTAAIFRTSRTTLRDLE